MKMKVINGSNQLSLIRDTEEVVKFLEFAARKNMMNEHAVNCRLTACHNMFSVVNDEEDNIDTMLANLDVFIHRLRNKNVDVKPSTLKVYKSRVKSSLEDYKSWSTDPFAWERAVTTKAKSAQVTEKREVRKPARNKPVVKDMADDVELEVNAEANQLSELLAPNQHKVRRVSFPIRPDYSVEVVIPISGISQKELSRLGMFLFPYCNDLNEAQTNWPPKSE